MSFLYKPIKDLIIGPFNFPTEAVFSVIAFIFLSYIIIKELKKQFKFTLWDYSWFLFAAIFGSLAGGRLFYYTINWKGPQTIIKIFDLRIPGLTSFGMIIGGIFAIMLFSYIRNRKTWHSYFTRYMDIGALAAALFIFIYRMGCFHYGDVPGIATDLPWAIFPVNYGTHSGTIMHPTALYLSFAALLIFIFLHWYRQRQKIDGEIGVLFLILYSFQRFVIEFFREDIKYYYLNEAQWYALVMLVVALILGFRLVYFFRDPKRKVAQADIVSPADGKILYIKEIKKGEVPISVKHNEPIKLEDILKSKIDYTKGVLIGIYLSIFDVHYQRAPISGTVKGIWYYKSRFNHSFCRMFLRKRFGLKPYYKNCKHILENERNIIHIQNDEHDCFVVQIADKVVNKIECYVRVGDKVQIGQKIGLIKMGSQVDLFITNANVEDFSTLKPCKKVFGGKSALKR